MKNSSVVMAIPTMRRKLIMLPTPKYLSMRNIVNPSAAIRPLLPLTKIVEKVKRSAKKVSIKNTGIAKEKSGSTKTTKKVNAIQTRRVTTKVGKKFFLFNISFFLS
jgi:hypothetical protein